MSKRKYLQEFIRKYSTEYFEKLIPLLNNLGWFISYIEIYGDGIEIKDKYNEKIYSAKKNAMT